MKSNRRGAAAVEFAVVAPIFFLIVLGMVETSRVLLLQHQINQTAIAAARDASLDGATIDTVREGIVRRGTMIGVKNWQVVVTPDPPTKAGYGENVYVMISCKLDENSWIPIPKWFINGTLSATQQARRETCQ